MNNQQNLNSNRETDIFILLTKFRSFLDSLGYNLFLFFRFIVKNIVLIAVLFILGAVLGYFADKKFGKKFKHEIIVTANFGSVDYLYEKINGINYDGNPIDKATIRPITDIYSFIKQRHQNLEMAKYMSDNSIKYDKYSPGNNVENFHRYHVITLYSKLEDENGSLIENFLNKFNNDPYFLGRQQIEKQTLINSIQEYEQSIENINNILARLGNEESTNQSNLEMNTYSELFQLINVKKSMIEELTSFRIQQLEQNKVIFDTARITNIEDNIFPLKLVFPFLFVGMFMVFVFARKIFLRYKSAHQEKTIA